MKAIRTVRALASTFPFLRLVRKLDESATPASLVSAAMECPAIAPQQIPSEFVELAQLVKEGECKRVLEIGTYRGGALFVFSRLSAADATIVSIDYGFSLLGKIVRGVQAPLFRRIVRPGQSLFLLRADSHSQETLDRIKSILKGQMLDFLFIDGDHSYDGVRQDFNMYAPLVRAGGLIAFHDIARTTGVEEVYRFWDEVKLKYRHREIMHRTDSGAMGIGILWP